MRLRSLTTRLAWFYGLSTAALLVVVSCLLYGVLTSALEHEDMQQIEQKITTLKIILIDQNGDPRALNQEILHENSENLATRIMSAKGQILLVSPGLNAILPARIFPLPRVDQPVYWDRVAGSKSYLLTSVSLSAPDGRVWIVQVALDVSADHAVQEKYQHYLLLCILGGIALAMLIGYWVAWTGLRPLTTMAASAERITATQLHERLDGKDWPAELKVLAQSFDAMLTRLEEAFQRLSQFSADLAHELRTPINNLMGEAEVALARPRTLEGYQQILESSLEEYGRLARLLDSLLFLARAEQAQMGVNATDFDGISELEVVVRYQSVLAKEHDIMLVCNGHGRVKADSDLFRRAVNNLLSNSLRYTPAGGRITVMVREVAKGSEIVVADNGIGIGAEHLARLGERFYRAGAQDHGGSGLGLALVRSIMDLHGGHMTLDSKLGQGTSVLLFFPG